MITILILLGAFLIYMSIAEAQCGILIAVIVIGLLLIGAAGSERKNYEAWRNMRDYWAEGGPRKK